MGSKNNKTMGDRLLAGWRTLPPTGTAYRGGKLCMSCAEAVATTNYEDDPVCGECKQSLTGR